MSLSDWLDLLKAVFEYKNYILICIVLIIIACALTWWLSSLYFDKIKYKIATNQNAELEAKNKNLTEENLRLMNENNELKTKLQRYEIYSALDRLPESNYDAIDNVFEALNT